MSNMSNIVESNVSILESNISIVEKNKVDNVKKYIEQHKNEEDYYAGYAKGKFKFILTPDKFSNKINYEGRGKLLHIMKLQELFNILVKLMYIMPKGNSVSRKVSYLIAYGAPYNKIELINGIWDILKYMDRIIE